MKIRILTLLAFMLTVLLAACNENWFQPVDCDDCFYPEPESAEISVKVTINDDNPSVPLEIYKGKLEENRLEWVDTTAESVFYLYVKTNEYYTVIAKYKSGTRTIQVIDGRKIKTLHVTDSCDDECWIIKGGKLDARLKY